MKKKIVLSILVGLLALLFIIPLFLTVSNSFMEPSQVQNQYENIFQNKGSEFSGLKFIPDWISLKQYYQVLILKTNFLKMFWNASFMVVPIILGQIIVSTFAAYAFAKLKFPFREQLFYLYILLMLMPFQVTVVPNYLIANYLGILDKFASIIFPGVFSVFGVFLLRQFMQKIPDAYLEAAKIDGANHFQIFFKIILPLSKNYIASLGVLLMIDYWNMVEQPLIFLKDVSMHPLSLYLAQVNKDEIGVAFAAATIYMIPVLLVYLYAENYFVEGIKNSGLKG
ncbi:carbohydrate ABC transporter permease [Crassaminicella profunda]|uniref:carbohydrate ABC transporter permease n=1 Tax=Crassaminicella profunda TaxID=1286698 RepID=UPI001FE304AE|nr:carbohydrate ABC transporter permease [Crassaminicella profunda]